MPSEIGGGLGTARYLQLGEDARHVVLDGLLGELQVDTDLPVRLAAGDLSKDPLLLSRESCQPLVAEQVFALAQPVQHGLCDGRIEQVLTSADGPNRPHQVTAVYQLEDVSGRPCH